MNFLLKVVLGIAMGVGGSLGIFLIWATLNDYTPPPIVDLKIEGEGVEGYPDELSLITWNIGYAGLGAEMDFFYDGGKTVIPPKEKVEEYLSGIIEFLRKNRADIIFLQEVDKDCTRTYGIDEACKISWNLPDYAWSFALNYKVKFVPVPFNHPMGKVVSGQMILGRYRPKTAKRYSLPGKYPWPKDIFMLDRCMIVWRLPSKNGKEWVLINLHNSAFDEGDIRGKQLEFIKKFILKEYERGNYVVVGGDWNHILPGVGEFEHEEKRPKFYLDMPKDWTPVGWKWLYDPDVPTNRCTSKPFRKGENFVTIIDGFLISPNIDVVEVKGYDMNFEFSDHQPAFVKLKIK
ncbi:MAG: endonuclease/exonuclease/phosphatase family protein [Thermotogae bacterium]|nr:endonuclease/exonuclease/phosphatase family protein [Thermotogota bacterium]